MPRIRKKTVSPVLVSKNTKKEDLSQHTLTLSRSKRTIKPNKKYLNDDNILSSSSNKSSRSNSPAENSDSDHSDPEVSQLSDSDEYEEPEPRLTRKAVLSTPVRKLQMKARVTIDRRLSKSTSLVKSTLFSKIQKANARPMMMNKTVELKKLERGKIESPDVAKPRGRPPRFSPQHAANQIHGRAQQSISPASKDEVSPDRRQTRTNKENSPNTSRPSSTLSQSNEKTKKITTPTNREIMQKECFVQIEPLKLPGMQRKKEEGKSKEETKKRIVDVKKKPFEVKKKVEAKEKPVAEAPILIDFEDFEDALPVFQCTNKSAEEEKTQRVVADRKKKELEAERKADFEERKAKEGAVKINRELNKKPKEYENKHKAAPAVAPLFTLVNINDIIKGVSGQPAVNTLSNFSVETELEIASRKPGTVAAAKPSPTNSKLARNFTTSTPMPKSQPAKKRPPTDDSEEEITPIKKMKKFPVSKKPTAGPKSKAPVIDLDEDMEDEEEVAPTRVLRRSTQQTSSDEAKSIATSKPIRKTINGKQVEAKAVLNKQGSPEKTKQTSSPTPARKIAGRASTIKSDDDKALKRNSITPTAAANTKSNNKASPGIENKILNHNHQQKQKNSSPPKPVITVRAKIQPSPKVLNQSPPKILNSTLKKHESPVGTTVSLKSKNGTTFTLKQTSPAQQRTNNNNSISASDIISKTLHKNLVRAGHDGKQSTTIIQRKAAVGTTVKRQGATTISTITTKTPPVVRRVTTFETWYVINVPADKEEKKESLVDLSMVTLGNNVKTLELPSSNWSYRITLSRLSEKETKERNGKNREVYTGDMSNDVNTGDAERNNYEPTNIMFRRISNNQKLSIQYDRAVIFKNSTFLINIDGKYCTLVGAPQTVSTLDDVVTLLSIVDDLTLTNSCVEQV